MRTIKKISNFIEQGRKILNKRSDSKDNTYSCDYINDTLNEIKNYSTEERRIGTWIDGKPLYQKVITGTPPTVITDGVFPENKFIATNVTSDMVFIRKMFGITTSGIKMNIPFMSKSGNRIDANISNDNRIIVMSNNINYNDTTCYFIINYTKKTD